MSGTLSGPSQSEAAPQPALSDNVPGTHRLGAGIEEAYVRLLQLRKVELGRGGGFSGPRLILALTHKYGHSLPDAKAAVERFKIAVERLEGNGKVEADLYPSNFGVTPVESALSRLIDVTTAARLMARSTPVTRTAERGWKAITDMARRAGLKIKTTENRAFYTTEMSCDEYSFYLMGWHATGKFAGGEKAILEFYDSREGEKPVLSIGVLNEENLTPQNEQKLIENILAYIKKLS